MSNNKPAKVVKENDGTETALLKLEAREKELEKAERNFKTRIRHHEEWRNTHETINRHIDKVVLVSLYILLVITTVYALTNVAITIVKATKNPIVVLFQTPPQDVDSSTNVNSSSAGVTKDETLILETVEHIFLYLLPLFIILGFFHYYKNNARYSLVDKSTGTVEEESSTKSMNITKVLFISSIISYVIIKIIEKVFIYNITNPTQLISYGVLLSLLMLFYLFLSRKSH